MAARAERIVGAGLALLLLAGCSGDRDREPAEAAPEKAPVAVAPTPAPGVLATPPPAAPVAPAVAAAVDAALAGVQAFNAKALADLAGIETAERRIRALAGQALEAARRGDGGRVAAARKDAEATHKGLADGLAALRTTAAQQTSAVEAALALCNPEAAAAAAGSATLPAAPPPVAGSPALASYEGCVKLPAEQALLTQNMTALMARHEAAEAAYRQDRTRLDEASATMALGR